MVYSSDRQPAFRDGEKTELLQPEIKIKVSSRKHNLDEDSRLNYAKLYTVEHNVRVCFIGEVDRRYMGRLVDTYNSINPPIDYDSTYQNHGVSSTSSGAQLRAGPLRPPKQKGIRLKKTTRTFMEPRTRGEREGKEATTE